jgi:hypothetical protein
MATTIPPAYDPLKPGRAGALKGGRCAICSAPLQLREAIEQRILDGEPVKTIGTWASKTFPELKGINYHSYWRHFRRHFKPMMRAAQKLSDAERMQRKQIRLAKSVLADKVDPMAYFAPAALAQDIQRTSARLEVAADYALESKQHSALASLSSTLIRAHELRGKLGGSIRDASEVNLNISLGELHQRLDEILGTDQSDRHAAARSLLGLSADAAAPARAQTIINPDAQTNPAGAPLTIDADALPSSRENLHVQKR